MTRSHTYRSIACFVLVAMLCFSFKGKGQGFNDSIIDAKLIALRQHIVADLKTKGSWHLLIEPRMGVSDLKYSDLRYSIQIGGIRTGAFMPWNAIKADAFILSYGGSIMIQHEFKESIEFVDFLVRGGVGYLRGSGLLKYSETKWHSNGQDYRDVTGRYYNHYLVFPMQLGVRFNARNSKLEISAGIDRICLPKILNTGLPELHRKFEGDGTRVTLDSGNFGTFMTLRFGMVTNQIKWIDSMFLNFSQSKDANLQGSFFRNYTIGLTIPIL